MNEDEGAYTNYNHTIPTVYEDSDANNSVGDLVANSDELNSEAGGRLA